MEESPKKNQKDVIPNIYSNSYGLWRNKLGWWNGNPFRSKHVHSSSDPLITTEVADGSSPPSSSSNASIQLWTTLSQQATLLSWGTVIRSPKYLLGFDQRQNLIFQCSMAEPFPFQTTTLQSATAQLADALGLGALPSTPSTIGGSSLPGSMPQTPTMPSLDPSLIVSLIAGGQITTPQLQLLLQVRIKEKKLAITASFSCNNHKPKLWCSNYYWVLCRLRYFQWLLLGSTWDR